jgi:2,4-dienoyl-CoA reductase-like NADH-dependent reductase (Old Yellow Enzyme family)
MFQSDEATLFTSFTLGELQMRNRVVMASMTRGRARNAEFAPTALHVEYYRQRASADLILTESASSAIESGRADLASFGKPFIGNPDLVRRLRERLPLSASMPETYYQGGPQGYIDYPTAA